MQAGFGVAGERGGQARVADPGVAVAEGVVDVVEPVRDVAWGGEVGDRWGEGFPDGAGCVEDWEGGVSLAGGEEMQTEGLRD